MCKCQCCYMLYIYCGNPNPVVGSALVPVATLIQQKKKRKVKKSKYLAVVLFGGADTPTKESPERVFMCVPAQLVLTMIHESEMPDVKAFQSRLCIVLPHG